MKRKQLLTVPSVTRFTLLPGLFAVALLCGVAAKPASAQTDCGTGGVYVGDFRLSAWKSSNFSGWGCRYYNNPLTWFTTEVNMTQGGYDAGVGRNGPSKLVDSMSQSMTIGATVVKAVVPTGSGHWWVGPKTIISQTSSYTGLTGNYECYIIETAEKSPNDLLNAVGGTNKTYRGESTFNGSVYKHYTILFEGINQVWSIRQNYRNGGTTSIGAIQKEWRRLNLVPNWYNLGWKYNIEYGGANVGKITFHTLSLPNTSTTTSASVAKASSSSGS